MPRDANLAVSQLNSKCKVSKSVLYNIRNQRNFQERKNWLFSDIPEYIAQDKLNLIIEEVIENYHTIINIKDIQNQKQKIHNISISINKITNILKENLKLFQ